MHQIQIHFLFLACITFGESFKMAKLDTSQLGIVIFAIVHWPSYLFQTNFPFSICMQSGLYVYDS